MNILVSSAGRRVSLVRAFKKELLKINPKGKVMASDANPSLSAACHVADEYCELPRIESPDYIEKLLSYCLDKKIKMVIPTIDTELKLFSSHKKDFKEKGVFLIVSNESIIQQCRDKRLIHSLFSGLGINVAKEYEKDNYKLPMFLKPWDGSRSVDTFLIRKESDLNDYHRQHKTLMYLEYLDHECFDEYTCDLYYNKKNELKCAVPRKRIQVRDGEVNKGITENGYLETFIKEKMNKIPGAIGCLTAQFFKHKKDDLIYGIEINPRFGGGFPLSYLSGANYPKWLIQEYLLNKEINTYYNSWESDLLMLRYDDEILVHGATSK